MKRYSIMAVLCLGLAGCGSFSALTGNASYDYEKETANGDKCSLNVNSGRTIGGAVGLTIDDNCGLSVQAEKVGQGNSAADLDAMLDKLLKLREPSAAREEVAPSAAPELPEFLAPVAPIPPDG